MPGLWGTRPSASPEPGHGRLERVSSTQRLPLETARVGSLLQKLAISEDASAHATFIPVSYSRACQLTPAVTFLSPAQLGYVTQLSSLRPCLCPRTPGTPARCAPRGWGRGRSTIPGTRGTHLPRSRVAFSTRYTQWFSSLEWLPAVLVRSLDQERACGRRWLGRWLVFCDRCANVIGRSKATVIIAASSAHGPRAISFVVFIPAAPRSERGGVSSPCVPACPSHGIPLTGQRNPSNEPSQPMIYIGRSTHRARDG